MFDWLFEAIASTLSFFYDLIPIYAVSIALLTIAVMIITTPFTLKGTRSMIQMQVLQPEMRRLQLKYKDDRQKLNEELMAFYKENNLNPLGGCLPLLLQAPIFIILFNVIRGLTHHPSGSPTFEPKYLDEGSRLFRDLNVADEMRTLGVDLAASAQEVLRDSFATALPHLSLVILVALTAYYQQKQIQGRNPDAEVPPQQKMLMRIFPAMFVVFAFVSPGGLVIYFVTSNLYRIGLQAYITRTLYRGEDSIGAKAALAAKEAKKLKEGGSSGTPSRARPATTAKAIDTTGDAAAPATDRSAPTGNGAKAASPKPTSRTSAPNRSKKKKKRR
jgi:YidC/Oxa1 family membrane protein insertase